MGVGGLLIPLVSIAAALTLLPALLAIFGGSLLRMRVPLIGLRPDGEGGVWARIAETIMRRPAIVAGLTAGFLILLALPAPFLSLTPGSSKGLPSQSQAVQGLQKLERTLGPGTITPLIAVVDSGRRGRRRRGGPGDPAARARAASRPRGHDRADADRHRPADLSSARSHGPLRAHRRLDPARLRHGRGQEARGARAAHLRPGRPLRRRARVRRRRPARGGRFHQPRLRRLPLARRSASSRSPTSCSCAPSARCCCRSRP